MGIFAEHAPAYWAAGIPVIPLKRWNSTGKGAGKAPILNEWTQYGEVMPTEAMRTHWLTTYPDSNIGLPFGVASGLCAIDIDTEDEELRKAIEQTLPKSPWVRVGKKGVGLIYKWSGQPNFKLRDSENKSIVEFLGFGNQMVLPPSIHPDTHKPYTSNVELYDVLEKIVELPIDLEKQLRAALEPILGEKGFTLAQTGRSAPLDVVPQGERDIQMVRHAGYLARVVLGIDKNAKFPLAEAMQHMATWVDNFTARLSGDDMDPAKGVAKLLEFLLKDVESGRTLPNGWDTGLTEDQRAHPTIAAMVEKNKVQRWTVQKAQEWLNANASEEDGADYVMAKIEELIEAVSADENFTEFQFKSLVPDIQRHAKKHVKLSKPDLVRAFKDARKGDVEALEDQAEIASQILEDLGRGGEIKHALGRFWQWNGSCFAPLDDEDIYIAIANGVKGNLLARRHGDYAAIVKTSAIVARSELGDELEPGVNFANGFLDTSLTLHEHSPKYGKTFTLPFDYIPERAGEAHKWFEYLEHAWGDDEDYAEKVLALQEAFAATMFAVAPKYQSVFLLHGRAKTGKTQALEVLAAMMPENSKSAIDPSLWSERFQLSPMVGCALNICGELPEAKLIQGRIFKEVVGGDPISTEYKGKDIFMFRPQAAHWFASNFLPRSFDSSEGFTRRWLIFDFNKVVQDKDRVPDYWRVLVSEEREAIAAWAVQGLLRLQQNRTYTMPSSSAKKQTQVLRGNNSVAAFLLQSQKIKVLKGFDCDALALFNEYSFYQKDIVRSYTVSFESFIQMLEGLGYRVEDYNDAMGTLRKKVHGIRLNPYQVGGHPGNELTPEEMKRAGLA